MFNREYARLQRFGRVGILHVHRALGDYRTAIGHFVYKVYRAARNFCAVFKHGAVHFETVKAAAAEGGNT